MFDLGSFGQYVHEDSLIHRLDPRVKFICLILFITCLLMLQHPLTLLSFGLFAFAHIFLARLPFKTALKSLKPILPLLIFAFLINALVTSPGDQLLLHIGFIRVSVESLNKASFMAFRLAALVFISNLMLALTTSAMQLCDGMASLLSPLERWHVPVQDIAMMMSIALRFVPTLMEESDKIMKAQTSRGADYDTGGLMKRLKGFVTVLVPLFISAFHRAEALASAMEARAYRSGIKRGKLHPLRLEKRDFFYTLSLILVLVLLIILDRSVLPPA